jgi:ketosteroid isomerase-like protein
MKTISIVVIIFAATTFIYTEEKKSGEDMFIQLETKWCEALMRSDDKFVEQTLADDATYFHATGLAENKTQFLEKMRSGARKFQSVIPQDLQVRTYGDTGIVTGRLSVKVSSGEKLLELENRFSHVFVKTAAGWQLAAHHASSMLK